MMGQPSIWVLTDDRAGHNAQVRGLAAQLGVPFDEKPLAYNWMSYLSQWVLGPSISHLEPKQQSLIQAPWPDMVIAAGRRTVPVMRYIKQQSPSTKLVQCMWPKRVDPFDLVITPAHDNAPNDPRIIKTIGALHGLNDERIAHESRGLESIYASLPRPYVAVMIGGSGAGWVMGEGDIKRICDLSELLSDGGSLLITTSRRTPDHSANLLRDRLTCPYSIYEWDVTDAPNPYPGLLGIADAIVTTGDSIAMCSEACFTGKPTFIYTPQNRQIKAKHQRFLSHLFSNHIAQPLGPESSMGWRPRSRLHEMPGVASRVGTLLSS